MAEPSVARELQSGDGDRTEHVLPGAAIYGANASGKTNVLRALADLRSLALNSFRSGVPGSPLPWHPFAFSSDDAHPASTRFELELILDNVRCDYLVVADGSSVREERLRRYPLGRAKTVFHREGGAMSHGSELSRQGRLVEPLLRSNALFLSTAAASGYEPALPLFMWFERNLILAESWNRTARLARFTQLIDDPGTYEKVRALIQAADLGVTGVERARIPEELRARLRRAVLILEGRDDEAGDIDIELPEFGFRLVHEHNGVEISMDPESESFGTVVWLGLMASVVEALDSGSVLLADELDASLHPSLVAQVVRLFQSPDTNRLGAQLIFNTHDTSLLGNSVDDRVLGRDQVWFTEKVGDGSTRLYPLTDSTPRREESVGRRYLAGMYGGIPIVSPGDFAAAVSDAEPAGA